MGSRIHARRDSAFAYSIQATRRAYSRKQPGFFQAYVQAFVQSALRGANIDVLLILKNGLMQEEKEQAEDDKNVEVDHGSE